MFMFNDLGFTFFHPWSMRESSTQLRSIERKYIMVKIRVAFIFLLDN